MTRTEYVGQWWEAEHWYPRQITAVTPAHVTWRFFCGGSRGKYLYTRNSWEDWGRWVAQQGAKPKGQDDA